MKAAMWSALALLVVGGYLGMAVLGWRVANAFEILTVDEYAALVRSQMAMQSLLSNPEQLCRRPGLM